MARTASTMRRVPSISVSGWLGRCAGRPSMDAKLGIVVPDAAAAAQAIGASRATAAHARERSQSALLRLSIGTFSTVQPMRVPDTNAIAAIAHQRPGGPE